MRQLKCFLMAAFTAIAFVACSNDDVLPDGGGTGNENKERDAWVAIKISDSNISMRSLNSPDEGIKKDGTLEESVVGNVRAIFFGSDKKVTEDIALTTAEVGVPGRSGSGGEAFKISSASKHLLIVVNAPSDFGSSGDQWVAGTEYNVVNAAISLSAGITDVIGTDKNAFFMTNANGYLLPYDVNDGLVDLTTYDDANAAAETPLSIKVDRVVAKVSTINGHTDGNDANDLIVKDMQWTLNVTNKKYFPASKRVKTHWENFVKDQSLSGGRVWSDEFGLGSYRKDPNYDNNTTSGDEYIVFGKDTDPESITWNNSGGSQYCLENTQQATENMHGYTTQVLVTANVYPFSLKSDVVPVDGGILGSWFKVGTTYYSLKTMQAALKQAIINGAAGVNFLNAFNAYYTKISGKNEISTDDDVDGILEEDLIAGTEGTVTCYKKSVNYYSIMIEHDNRSKQDYTDTRVADADIPTNYLNALGEYGVVRNSFYEITISKFLNPGKPIIPDPDPKEPDENENVYMAISIDINPWTYYTQSIQL